MKLPIALLAGLALIATNAYAKPAAQASSKGKQSAAKKGHGKTTGQKKAAAAKAKSKGKATQAKGAQKK